MADSHTPGPWIQLVGHQTGRTHGIGAESTTIVRFGGIGRPSSEEGQANARLIAAAPCLLEALRDLLRETGSIVTACPDIHRARKAAEAAIAKATGVTGG